MFMVFSVCSNATIGHIVSEMSSGSIAAYQIIINRSIKSANQPLMNELIISVVRAMVELQWFLKENRRSLGQMGGALMSSVGVAALGIGHHQYQSTPHPWFVWNDRRPAAVSWSTKSFWITGRPLIQNLLILGGSFCTMADLSRSVFFSFFPFYSLLMETY